MGCGSPGPFSQANQGGKGPRGWVLSGGSTPPTQVPTGWENPWGCCVKRGDSQVFFRRNTGKRSPGCPERGGHHPAPVRFRRAGRVGVSDFSFQYHGGFEDGDHGLTGPKKTGSLLSERIENDHRLSFYCGRDTYSN